MYSYILFCVIRYINFKQIYSAYKILQQNIEGFVDSTTIINYIMILLETNLFGLCEHISMLYVNT